MENKQVQQYGLNEIIFRQGEEADCMYDIVSGSVNIYVNFGKEDQHHLITLKVGNCFGEMGMIEGIPRSATAVAAEDNTCLQVVDVDSFTSYFREKPEKVLDLMRHMSGRIRNLTSDYLDACRAVAETNEAAQSGKRSSWLRDHIKHFLDDYNEATKHMNEHPAAFYGTTIHSDLFYF